MKDETRRISLCRSLHLLYKEAVCTPLVDFTEDTAKIGDEHLVWTMQNNTQRKLLIPYQ